VVLHQVLRWLEHRGIYAWRNSVGAYRIEGRWIQYGLKGSSDVLGILADGRLLAVECKTDRGRLSFEQERFLKAVRDRGGCAIVARHIDDLEEALGNQSLLDFPRKGKA
jgi:hypothetical protein